MKALEAFEVGYWGRNTCHRPELATQLGAGHSLLRLSRAVRRIIYTTNAIEALNSKLRRAVRTRGHFPGDDAAMKLLYLVLNNAAEQWKRAAARVGLRPRPSSPSSSANGSSIDDEPASRTEFLTVRLPFGMRSRTIGDQIPYRKFAF